ncbi:hypothetical protein CEUSTIGMA_g342.t1 [Chlamydomonas eustigma]|uniref:Nodulin-like domain-containing protein n=1 Tax=Chlamydomonas eustigma TaxID=1157962 RepID=A0A250WPW8_9CHLO|nr:hypothetical protein CEUSTIGMA_g342.t1 [Chlamydomonas eustigma]|eukprot:GAX72887.1 hypothetical protein CEUSTIGMA_g342.t1 [Chlamydomonas eustigma]
MYWNRWIVFVACALLQTSAGLNYSFSVFAPTLKTLFHLDEVQLGTLATLGFNLGGYFALACGAVYDLLGNRNHVGPRAVILIGASLMFTGYFGIYCMAQGVFPYSYELLLIFALIAGNSGCWYDTAALATCIKNYPEDRGTVVGILKSFLGLSATIYTAAYVVAFQPDTVMFLLFLSLCPTAIAVIMALFICRVPNEYIEQEPAVSQTEQGGENSALEHTPVDLNRKPRSGLSKHTRFAIVYLIVTVLALVSMVSAVWSAEHHVVGPGRRVAILVLMALLAAMLLVPISSGPCMYPRRRWKLSLAAASIRRQSQRAGAAASAPGNKRSITDDEEENTEEPLLNASNEDEEPDTEGDGRETAPVREMSTSDALRTSHFWIIMFQALMGIGSGLGFVNNLSGQVIAMGGAPGGQLVFVSLFSVANASGRMALGYMSETYLHNHGTPRTLFLVIVSLLTTVCTACLSFAKLPDLYAMALLSGFAFGGNWAVIPAILSDLFGLKHYASTYAFFQLAPAGGGYILGTLLIGEMYQAAMRAHGDDTFCVGTDCYGYTWRVMTCLNIVALIGTRVLMQRTRSAYGL